MHGYHRARFNDPDAARQHLEALRWPEGPFCPHCGSFNATRLPAQRGRPTKAHPEGAIRSGVIQCNDCREQYSVTVGTVFESSKIGLHKWVLATFLLCSSKRGISGHQLARMLGVTQKTAWFMSHRIREAMRPVEGEPPLGGEGKATTFYTDDAGQYRHMNRDFTHEVVNHGKDEYVRGKAHTNTVEGYFSILKRGITGTYYHLSAEHLHRYCVEFDFRYNTRKENDFERCSQALKGIYGRRLTYRRADQIAA